MTYRKLSADYIFTGTALLSGNYVLITDDKGKIQDIVHSNEAGEDVENLAGILSPGFINAHCHIELSHLRNIIPEQSGLVDFVFKVVTERHFADEEILNSIKMAEEEMIENGIVAVGDICNNILSLPSKKSSLLECYNFIEVSGWDPGIASTRFEKSRSVYAEFLKNNQKASLVPHAPYSVSPELWGKITPFFQDKVITIHNQETQDEDVFFIDGSGMLQEMYRKMNINNSFYKPSGNRSIQNYFKNFSAAASVILVHNTFMKQEDIDFISESKRADQGLSFCLCPNANLYIEQSLPPVNLLMQNNCNIIMGTDSLASNHQLSVLEELKTISKHLPAIPLEILLQWATINGAKALQMDGSLGSFERGKQPGVILIENIENKKLTGDSSAKRIL